jgi:hypothetical protein
LESASPEPPAGRRAGILVAAVLLASPFAALLVMLVGWWALLALPFVAAGLWWLLRPSQTEGA